MEQPRGRRAVPNREAHAKPHTEIDDLIMGGRRGTPARDFVLSLCSGRNMYAYHCGDVT